MKNQQLNKHIIFYCLAISSPSLLAASIEQPSLRIVGGEEVSNEYEFPSVVSLKYTANSQHFCGASLINEQWVLTAAHCMVGLSTNDIVATVGEYDLSSTPETNSTSVEGIIIHPGYNTSTFDNDIALIKLSTAVSNDTISLLSRIETEEAIAVETTISTAIGWGSTVGYNSDENVTPDYPSILNMVSLPLLSATLCSEKEPNTTDNMICAGDVINGGIDSCQGDSGGPLLVESASTGETQQIGIVSFGDGCAAVDKPGVYTKIANYEEWINSQINGLISVSATDYFVADIDETNTFSTTIKNQSSQTISPSFSLSNTDTFTLQTTECNDLITEETCTVTFDYSPNLYGEDTTNLIIETHDDLVPDSSLLIKGTAMKSADAEALTFSENSAIRWYESNTLPWLVSSDSSYLNSPEIYHQEITEVTAIFSEVGVLSFNWAVSSELNYDFLTLFINGVKIESISGEQQFVEKQYDITETDTVVTWQYSKDGSVDDGLDVAFLHNVQLDNELSNIESTEEVIPSLTLSVESVVDDIIDYSTPGSGSLQWWNLLLLMLLACGKQVTTRMVNRKNRQ